MLQIFLIESISAPVNSDEDEATMCVFSLWRKLIYLSS